MVRKAKVDYDKENDILWIYFGEPVKDSLEIDKFVIEFSHDDKIIGVEIFDASKTISKLTLKKISKQMLMNIKQVTLRSFQSKELIYVIIGILFEREKLSMQIPAPITVRTS